MSPHDSDAIVDSYTDGSTEGGYPALSWAGRPFPDTAELLIYFK